MNEGLADDRGDRTDRRVPSIFRLGWDFIERCLALDDPIPITFVRIFGKVSGC